MSATSATRSLLRGYLSTVIIESPVLIGRGRNLRRNGTTVRSHLADDVQDGRTLCGLRLQELGADVRVITPRRSEFEDHAFENRCGMCERRLREAVLHREARSAAGYAVPGRGINGVDVYVVTRRLSPLEPGLYAEEASDLGLRAGQLPAVIRLDTGERVIDLLRVERERAPQDPDNLLGYRFDRDGDLLLQDYASASGADALRLFND